jgi:hypothetical protein
MLSNQELKYFVKKKNFPYPGEDYCKKTFEEVKRAVELYKEEFYGRVYQVTLSDDSSFTFMFWEKSLAHILGINYETMVALGVDKVLYGDNRKVTTFEFLNDLVNDIDNIVEYTKNNDKINFYKIKVKTHIFNKFIGLHNLEFGCLNFNRDKAALNGISTQIRSDKILFIESVEDRIQFYMLGIAERKAGDRYTETLLAFEQPYRLMAKQEILMPVKISVRYGENFIGCCYEEIELMQIEKRLQQISNDYGCSFVNKSNGKINNEIPKILVKRK